MTVAFTASCDWRGRSVSVQWSNGQLTGDPDFVAFLRSQEQCGEPIGLDADGRVEEVSFATQDLALASLVATVGYLSSLEGDVDDEDLAYCLPGNGRA